MKLVTFEVQTVLGRFSRVGALLPQALLPSPESPGLVVDLNAAYAWLLAENQEPEPQRLADVLCPSHMRLFIAMGTRALDAAKHVLKAVENQRLLSAQSGLNGQRLVFALNTIKLKAPLPDPSSLRDFMSFEAHTRVGFERRNEAIPDAWYKYPIYYKGNPHSIIGPDEPVSWPAYTRKLDYELELACIIGQAGRNISKAEAPQHIFGYAILNDWSARDIQKHEMLGRLGPAKAKDFATALGPYIVTADEVGNARQLSMSARVNGECWSQGHSSTAHWWFDDMIAHVSKDEDLQPGDILGSGTVGGGCGFELDRWVQPGDVVELEIEGLGILRNTVLAPGQTAAEVAFSSSLSEPSADIPIIY